MKSVFFTLIFLSFSAFAQNVSVKDVAAQDDTTIEIRKGIKTDQTFEITEGTEDVEGDAAPLIQTARANWKTACADWKKELKEMNKENSILTASCGKMTCKTAAMESTCSSTAKYKLKIRVK